MCERTSRSASPAFRVGAVIIGVLALAGSAFAAKQAAPSKADDPGARLVARLYQSRRGTGRSVPDTLDLQDNALLSIHAITSGLDPDLEHRAWFAIYFDRRPMVMRHHILSEFDLVGKYAEGLTLMRLMTGSSYNKTVDSRVWNLIDSHTKDDGLLYYDLSDPKAEPIYTYSQARALLARICRYELTPNPADKAKIERTIDSLIKRKMTRGFGFGVLLPACRWYELTGSLKALELAKLDFTALQNENTFSEDGSFEGHFHYHTGAAIGMLAYGLITHNDALVRKVCRIYEFARSKGTDYGYFPECVPGAAWVMLISNEGCCTADMTCLAAALSRCGAGDYWDDLDRYARNQLTEMQMKRTDFTDRIPNDNQVQIPVRPAQGEHILDDMTRFIGAFAGWAAPNDFCGPAHFWIQQCCLGNAPRALYAVWENIVTSSASGLRVNLLLNRSTPEIDVDSYLPYEGRVDISMKKNTPLAVRIPVWVDLSAVRTTVDGRRTPASIEGRYLSFPNIKSGSKVRIRFPVSDRWVTYRIPCAPWASKYSVVDEDSGSGMQLPRSVATTPPDIVEKILTPVDYKAHYMGSTIIEIKPGGTIYPLYLRASMRGKSKAPVHQVDRHVPSKLICNWY